MNLIISRRQNGYDVIVELGYNDAPPLPGRGSAIFMHVAQPDYSGTEGCIAFALADLLQILERAEGTGRVIVPPDLAKKTELLTSRFQPITKNCRAHADVGRTECDSNLVIPAHSHTELFQLMTQSNFTQ